MGFPPSVADEVLVKCGRHCCLCGKYAGLKMELHHIKQVADGGENTAENCIPLCLDCHAEVGSYNPHHPKGRKYTEKELKGHRDKFYAIFSNMPDRTDLATHDPRFAADRNINISSQGYSMDVFVSCAEADKDIKNTLVDRFRKENIACRVSDEQYMSTFAQDGPEGIENCGVFIVIISNASMNTAHVRNEIIAARRLEDSGLLNILVYKVNDEAYTPEFDACLNHITSATGNLIRRKVTLSGETAIDQIVHRTKRLLQKRTDGDPERPFDVRIPKIDGIKISRNSYFVPGSRADTLASLEESLNRSNVVVLNDLFGYGKRTVIKQFLQLHQDMFSTCLMLSNSHNSLREFIIDGLNFSNINPKRFDALSGDALINEKLRLLERLDKRTLLVITGIKDEYQADTLICDKLLGMNCRIILVIEGSADHYKDWFPTIKLGRMTNDQLATLFFHYYPYSGDEEKQILTKSLEAFFDRIGGHTQAVELTARALSANDMWVPPEEVPQYLSGFGNESTQLKDQIMAQLSHVLDIEHLTKEEIVALLAASYIASPHISEKNYFSVLTDCGVNPRRASMRLIKRRWMNLDVKTKTISIEPLIAQLVQNKYQVNYRILTTCYDFLINNSLDMLKWSANGKSTLGYLRKLVNLLSIAHMPEEATLVEMMLQYHIDELNFDYDNLANVIASYEKKHAHADTDLFSSHEPYMPELASISDLCRPFLLDQKPDPSQIEQIRSMMSNSIVSDMDEHAPEDIPEYLGFDDDCTDMDIMEADERDFFISYVHDFLESGILSHLKLISCNVFDLLTDFSREGLQLFTGHQMDSTYEIFSTRKLFGISSDMLNVLRFQSRYITEETEDWDEASLAFLDAMNALESFFRKDYAGLMISLNSALNNLSQNPDMLDNELLAMALYQVASFIAIGYIKSNAPRQAMVLCEKILQYDTDSCWKTILLRQYIEALRASKQYSAILFDSYQTLLENMDQSQVEAFDSKTDLFGPKKELMLMYAQDLAFGGQIQAAREQFAAAQKLNQESLLDDVVYCASTIVDAMVKSGAFDQAAAFLDRYFDTATIRLFRENCSPAALNKLDECILLKEFSGLAESDFSSNDSPRKYISYYQDFSRKNNTLLERKYYAVADKAIRFDFSHLTDEEIALHTAALRLRAKTEKKHLLAPEAFALASEAGFRVLGYKHHYVQYMGAAAMADGKVAEILNGEGKTYTIVLVAYLNSLYGQKVCIVDRSAYLSKRNHAWMHGVYELLGVSHELLESESVISAKTANQQADVSYVSINHLVFGFLRNECRPEFQRAWFRLNSAIIDEIDTVLVDSAKTSYHIVSSNRMPRVDPKLYLSALNLSREVGFDDSIYTFEKNSIQLQPGIHPLIEREYGISYDNLQDLEAIKLAENIVSAAILCRYHMTLNRDYFIHEGKIVKENTSTGAFDPIDMPQQFFLRSFNGLNALKVLEAHAKESEPMNSICIRSFFKQFDSICGTTATAVSFKNEFKEIYDLDYVSVPPYKPCRRINNNSPIYVDLRFKERAIIEMVAAKHSKHQPILLVTQSIQESEKFSQYLREANIPHTLLDARNSDESSDLIALSGMPDSVLVATAIVNRGTDIKLGGDPELRSRRELVELGMDVTELDDLIYGIPTQKQQQSELYQRFCSIFERNKVLAARDRQKAIDAGGLCVIGTGFFPEPRTEQQIRGRSGRQGDVGESWVFFSIEDKTLINFFSDSYREWMQSYIGNDATIDGKFLYNALQSAQQKLHADYFAAIRQVNKSSQYIDDARNNFIGRKLDLADHTLTTDDIFWEWTGNPRVQQWLSMLQAGETSIESPYLTRLYSRNPKLQRAKGRQARRILFEAIKSELPIKDEHLVRLLTKWYVDAWTAYIGIATSTTKKSEMKEKAAVRILMDEKEKLLSKMMDQTILRFYAGSEKRIRITTPDH